jgi:hypothetical protein
MGVFALAQNYIAHATTNQGQLQLSEFNELDLFRLNGNLFECGQFSFCDFHLSSPVTWVRKSPLIQEATFTKNRQTDAKLEMTMVKV